MIIWLYRQIKAVRKALAGRDHPEELAWAMALGVLLGVVPKGNLVAIVLVVLLLALRVNHAMAAVTTVAVSFAAVVLDPFTHQLGQWVLGQAALQSFFTWSWQQPLVPWTDLNNTVVMGSLLLGLMTLFPTYSITLPIFRSLANKQREESADALQHDDHPKLSIAELVAKDVAETESATEPEHSPKPQFDVIRVRRSDAVGADTEATSDTSTSNVRDQQITKQEKAA